MATTLLKNLFTIKSRIISLQSIVCQSYRFKSKGGPSFPQFVNLPPHYQINGTGSAYETKIDRKRQIKDPNLPNFEKQEALRWSDWRMLRDCRRRYIFARYHPMRQFLYTIRKSKLLPSNIRESALEETLKLPRDSAIQHLTNRCVISSRARGKVRRYKISRHMFRGLADYNMLSGVAKACW